MSCVSGPAGWDLLSQLYLAAAGIGRLGLIDYDIVDFSNLQRQILHGTDDVGRKKLNSARDRIKAINPNVQVDLHEMMFRSENAMQVVQDYDIVIDGTDNFPTRYLSNDVCVLQRNRISTARSFDLTVNALFSLRIWVVLVIDACSRTTSARDGA